MKGSIVAFDEATHSGKISGHDGQRYNFTRQAWNNPKPPKAGMEVDFEVEGNIAKDIILVSAAAGGSSSTNKTTLLLVCWFVGIFGIHRFMVGKAGTGVLMLLTLGGCGVWTIIDFIMIIMGKFTDAEGNFIV